MARLLPLLSILLISLFSCYAFIPLIHWQNRVRSCTIVCRQLSEKRQNDKDEDEEELLFSVVSRDANNIPVDKSLTGVPVNWRKESILFGENPATAANNNALHVWKLMKRHLPFVLTGARRREQDDTTADDNPLGGIYNTIFVRLPTILAGIIYGKNLLEGHPLIVDFGDGPFEMNPLLVLGVLYFILR